MPCTLRLALLAAALSSACASMKPPPPLHVAKLEVHGKEGRSVSAYVHAKVAGQPLRLSVDTGAMQSTLPLPFAQKQKLPRREGSSEVYLVDAHGERTRVIHLPDVPVQFDGEQPGKLDFLLNTSQMSDLAVLVPQDLVRRGQAVVIDYRREELRYEPEEAAVARLRAEGPLAELPFSGCSDDGFIGNPHRAVTVVVGGVSSPLMIDTGASATVIGKEHPAHAALSASQGEERRTVGLASLGRVREVSGVSVAFAGATRVLPVLLTPGSVPCGGVLGTDVLRDCTLVWGWSRLWVACGPPRPAQAAAAR